MSDDIPPLDPKAYITSHAYIHHRPTDARQVMLDLTRERDEARAEVERLTRERDEVRAEVERLREALRWYGARVRELSTPHDALVAYSDLMDDSGARARNALEDGR